MTPPIGSRSIHDKHLPMAPAAEAQPAPPPTAAPLPAPAKAPIIDTDRALEVWQDAELYHKVLRKFAAEYADCVDRLSVFQAKGDSAAIAALLHKLKGTAGSLALLELAQLAATMEHCTAAGHDLGPAIERLHAAFSATLTAIAELAQPAPPPTDAFAGEVDGAVARPLLRELLRALDTDSPDAAEPLLVSLAPALPGRALTAIRTRLEDFDFRGAERLVHQVAAEFGITMEE